MSTYRMYTDEKEIQVNTESIESLKNAMIFKSENIKAKADPEIFKAVADELEKLSKTK